MRFGKLSVGELSFGELSVGEMSVRGIVGSENSPSRKCLRGNVRRGNVLRGKIYQRNARRRTVRIPLELQNINKDLLTYFTKYKAKKDHEVIKKHNNFMFYKICYFLVETKKILLKIFFITYSQYHINLTKKYIF